jgi:HAMP domain-containing protein
MGLRAKFNLCLFIILGLGLASFGALSYQHLKDTARAQVQQEAKLLMQTALAVRDYTTKQIKPHLETRLDTEFLPQVVPAFSAAEVLGGLRKSFPAYGYKEAALNPTNPRDKATDWEATILNAFRNQADLTIQEGQRQQDGATYLYLARPIKISDVNCLICHSTPDAAPASMIRLYGDKNGFGWLHNETVATQIVTVPEAVPLARAWAAFQTFMIALIAVFIVLAIVLHTLLNRLVITPLEQMALSADAISKGKLDVPELPEAGKDEVSKLAASFNRMIRTLKRAMTMLDK